MDTGKTVAVAIIKRKVESMLSVGDKPAAKSNAVRGSAIEALGIVLAAIAACMQGERGWDALLEAVQNPIVSAALLAAIGRVWHAIGQRRAIAASGPNGGQ